MSFAPASAHDSQGATARARKAFAVPNVMTTVQAGDFEGVRRTVVDELGSRPSSGLIERAAASGELGELMEDCLHGIIETLVDRPREPVAQPG